MIDETRIAEIEGRLAAATPGPWFHGNGYKRDLNICIMGYGWDSRNDSPTKDKVEISIAKFDPYFTNDQELCINAPTDQRYLLDLVQSLREELTRERTKSRDMERLRHEQF